MVAKLYDYCATCRQKKPASVWAYCCSTCEHGRVGRDRREPAASFDVLEQLRRVTAARDVVPHWERDRLDAEASRLIREALGVPS